MYTFFSHRHHGHVDHPEHGRPEPQGGEGDPQGLVTRLELRLHANLEGNEAEPCPPETDWQTPGLCSSR